MAATRATVPDESHGRYSGYCPLHEFDFGECDRWCLPRRAELRLLAHALRQYWLSKPLYFVDRWNGGRGRAHYR